MEKFLDCLAGVLGCAFFITPFVTVVLSYKLLAPLNKVYRVAVGLILSAVFCAMLFYTSLAVLFRHGMGPG